MEEIKIQMNEGEVTRSLIEMAKRLSDLQATIHAVAVQMIAIAEARIDKEIEELKDDKV